jgi:hypothetical protein
MLSNINHQEQGSKERFKETTTYYISCNISVNPVSFPLSVASSLDWSSCFWSCSLQLCWRLIVGFHCFSEERPWELALGGLGRGSLLRLTDGFAGSRTVWDSEVGPANGPWWPVDDIALLVDDVVDRTGLYYWCGASSAFAGTWWVRH